MINRLKLLCIFSKQLKFDNFGVFLQPRYTAFAICAGLENVRGPDQHFRVHDLRHTIGARLREESVSREDRKDILGHANNDITTHYSTAETTYLVDLLERIAYSKRPSLYVIKNTPATHSDSGENENVASA